jgi:hypothetical protein
MNLRMHYGKIQPSKWLEGAIFQQQNGRNVKLAMQRTKQNDIKYFINVTFYCIVHLFLILFI